jgi:hypothetical protein
MWQLINRENGKCQENNKKLKKKKIGNNIISNPTENAEKRNKYFKILWQNWYSKILTKGVTIFQDKK